MLARVWSRPAVSTMMTPRPRALPAASASKTTAAGRRLTSRESGRRRRSVQTASCSTAAARNVGRTDEHGLAVGPVQLRELPTVVVLPVPDADDGTTCGRVVESMRATSHAPHLAPDLLADICGAVTNRARCARSRNPTSAAMSASSTASWSRAPRLGPPSASAEAPWRRAARESVVPSWQGLVGIAERRSGRFSARGADGTIRSPTALWRLERRGTSAISAAPQPAAGRGSASATDVVRRPRSSSCRPELSRCPRDRARANMTVATEVAGARQHGSPRPQPARRVPAPAAHRAGQPRNLRQSGR